MQHNKLYPTFVPNFKILGSVVPEKSLMKKSIHTHTFTEKTKTIYPLYTLDAGGIIIQIQHFKPKLSKMYR